MEEWAAAARRISPNAYETVILFIDGTVRPTCRPRPSEYKLSPGINLDQVQRAQYNGHKRRHAFKGHAVVSPSGMVIHYFGAVDGRHHDVYLLNESGLHVLCITRIVLMCVCCNTRIVRSIAIFDDTWRRLHYVWRQRLPSHS